MLSGKYTRHNHGSQKPDRGAFAEANLTERAYDIVDALIAIAQEKDSTPARVALAWLAQKPGVTSIIIGARRLDQLEDNLAAADLALSAEQVQKLDELSKPALGFPAAMLDMVPSFAYAGTTINGKSGPISPWVPQKGGARY